MPSIVQFLSVLSLGVLLGGSAHAQLTGFYPMGADSLSLNDEDFRLMIDAANGLLRQSPLRTGAETTWKSQSGSNGSIHVTETFNRNAMLCHTLVYETMPGGTPQANRTTLDWCNTGGGA